ncbi:MAG TPA: iron hydrogenase small subunit [Spirochaetota bacterium]|nr:iron hydrogenase small subunit [Spirochaetota bacterium]HPJ36656.1 iron hydrogenase small subunit [Spirochaetota bacterium]
MKSQFTRKKFIRTLTLGIAAVSFVSIPVQKLFAGLTNTKSRTDGVYEQDKKMPLRKSQDNPMIKQIYKDFLEHPNSHKAHELLHTDYVDRSAGVKRLRQSGIRI